MFVTIIPNYFMLCLLLLLYNSLIIMYIVYVNIYIYNFEIIA